MSASDDPRQRTNRASEDSLTQEVDRRRVGRGTVILTLLALAAAGALGGYAWKLRQHLGELRRDNRDLSDALELHRTSSERLDTELASCNEELTQEKVVHVQSDQRATQLDIALDTCRSSVKNLEQQQQKADARLRDFKQLTRRFQRMIDTGKLDVVFRRGEMIVKLPAAILFASGKADVSDSGRAALKEVASILGKMPRRRFTVAGHTDNVPVKSAPFPSNWELSTARAVAVTKELIRHGLAPDNLVAAGYGQFAPIGSNRTKRGRRQNRRIEIILEPNLRPVPDVDRKAGDED